MMALFKIHIAFLVTTPRGLVGDYQCVISILKMATVCCSETMVPTWHTRMWHYPENHNINKYDLGRIVLGKIAAGPRQQSHSWFPVTRDSWLYFCLLPPEELIAYFQSYFTTGGLPPISSSWRQKPRDPRPEILFSNWTLAAMVLMLTRWWVCRLQLLLVLASAVTLRSEFHGTHDHILLSHIRDSPDLQGCILSSRVLCYDRRSASQSVLEWSTHMGLKIRFLLLSDSRGFVDVGRSLWREDRSVVYNCCWSSPA
jgi:hypothetical protein